MQTSHFSEIDTLPVLSSAHPMLPLLIREGLLDNYSFIFMTVNKKQVDHF